MTSEGSLHGPCLGASRWNHPLVFEDPRYKIQGPSACLTVPEAVFAEVQKMWDVYPKGGFRFLFLPVTRTGEHLCHQAGPDCTEPGSSHWRRRCHPNVPTRSIFALLTQHSGVQRFGGAYHLGIWVSDICPWSPREAYADSPSVWVFPLLGQTKNTAKWPGRPKQQLMQGPCGLQREP